MAVGYLGVGSNVGDRRGHLQQAVRELRRQGVSVLASSSVYETEPVGVVREQPDFLNACLQVQSEHGPEELLDVCKAVEGAVGRTGAEVRHGPREIDVDLLLLDETTYSSERLRLPHLEVTRRRFVIVPLLELDPELRLPDGTALADALSQLGEGQEVRLAGEPLELR